MFLSLKEFITKKWKILIFPTLLFFLGFAIVFYDFQAETLQKKKTEVPSHVSSTLSVLSATPKGKALLPDRIYINFSEAVDAHMVEHFFILSPSVPGNFENTNDGKTVIFVPATPFERGKTYVATVGLGLKSETGKLLEQDYTFTFQTELAETEILFVKDYFSGRVFTMASNQENSVTLQKGKDIGTITINIYNSTSTQFFAFLAYTEEKKKDNNYEYIVTNYINNNIPHRQLQLRETIKIENFVDNETKVPLPKEQGLYYIEAKGNDGKSIGSTYAVISSTGLTFRQDDQSIVVAESNIHTGTSIADSLEVGVYSSKNAVKKEKTIQFGTLARSAYGFNEPIDFLYGEQNGNPLFVPVKLPKSQADIKVTKNLSQSYQIFLYTERPIYKPGDTVFYRGVVRTDNDGLYSLPQEGLAVDINASFDKDNTIKQTVTVDTSGVFHGLFTIPDSLVLPKDWVPIYYVYARALTPESTGQRSEGNAYFSVAKYEKPEFGLSTSIEKNDYLKNDTISVTIDGSYFDGKPFANQEVQYQWYIDNFIEVEKSVYNQSFNVTSQAFGMCGGGFNPFEDYYGSTYEGQKNITLDGQGKATVTVSLKDASLDSSKKLTLVATKKDSNGNTIVSAITSIVHQSAYNLFFSPSPVRYKAGDQIVLPISVERRDQGNQLPDEIIVSLKQQSNAGGNSTTKDLQVVNQTVEANGKGTITLTIPPEMKPNDNIFVDVKITDENGNITRGKKQLTIIADEKNTKKSEWWNRGTIAQTYLKIVSQQNSYKIGDIINLTVTSPQTIDTLMTLERGRIYEPKIITLQQGVNNIQIPVTETLSPSITVAFTFFKDGTYYSEGLSVTVPAMHKLMTVTISADKTTYRPGEIAILRINTRDAKNNPVPATLSLGVVDKAIYALRKNATPPIHSSFYFFRGRQTNASSNLTWIGEYLGGYGGGGGGNEGMFAKDVDTLYWNPLVTTDQSGNATVTIQIPSTETTWKALIIGASDTSDLGQSETEFIVHTE